MSRSILAIALATLLVSVAVPANATPPPTPDEFFVGIGDAGLLFAFEDVFTTAFSFGYITYGDEQLGFQVVGGYQRHLSEWGSLGVTASWAGSQREMFFDGDYAGDVERRMYSLMLDGRARWLRRPGWQLYSGLALGAVALTDEDEDDRGSESGLGWHLIPLGVRVGREVAGFAEVGVGWHGFLKAGLTRRW
jgi:hypothetical protein